MERFVSLFKSNHLMEKLEYFEPIMSGGRVIVSPLEEDIEEGISKWKLCLVGQFFDKPLPFYFVKKSVAIMWKHFGEVEVFSLENGMYLFRFSDEGICDEVLESKLWHVGNKPLILRKWEPGMQVLKLTLASIPMWVKFLHLPLEYWSTKNLSCIASGVGKPLYADKMTEDK